jgi:thioredoxin-related protein
VLAALAAVAAAGAAGAAAQAPSSGHEPLTRIEDLRALVGQVRREQRPLLLFFTVPGCPFCLEVRRSHLGPLGRENRGPLIREVEVSSERTFIGLDGRKTTEHDFASSQNVRMVPHVVLVDAELRPLAEPMVGIGVADFYGAYLARAIDAAMRRLPSR